MNVRSCITALGLIFATGPAQAQFTDFLRGITGALGGTQRPVQQQTATIGVRGMDEVNAASGGPALEDYALMERWTSSENEARMHAHAHGLAARRVGLSDAPAARADTGGVRP